MTIRPARITQAEVARIIRAAKQAGASEVVIRRAGRPDLRLSLSRDIGAVGDQIAAHLARPPRAVSLGKGRRLFIVISTRMADCCTSASHAMSGGAKPITVTGRTGMIPVSA